MRPNIGAALRQHLLASADVTDPSIAGQKIYIGWPTGDDKIVVPDVNNKFPNVIIIRIGLGGAGDLDNGLREERVAFRCYGANELQAWNMWCVLDYYLIQPDMRTPISFTRANCTVNHIRAEGAPLKLYDPDAANWPFTEGTYIVNFRGTKVS